MVIDDPVALLERELVEAARRRAMVAPRRRRPTFGGIAALVLVAASVAVAGGAVILLRAHKRPPARSASAIPGRQQLIEILGVLRRPQTKEDLDSPAIKRFFQNGPPFLAGAKPELSLIRRATTTPWGDGVFVIPVQPTAASSSTSPPIDREAVDMEVGFGGGCCATAAAIQARGVMQTDGAGRSFAGGSTAKRVILLVPDGVSTVDFLLPRQPSPWDPTAPVYRSVLTVAARVHGNVAAVEVNRECCDGNLAMVWRGPGGHVIKRIGNFAALDRVVRPPQPAPETALSRSAERNPSTPNPVWVTPSSGAPDSNFSVHFRLLLNDADYRFSYSGATCPQITLAGGGGGGTGDLRGRIFSMDLDAVAGQTWCRGTYHLSATVMDLGRYGDLKHPAKPFGTATFTVR